MQAVEIEKVGCARLKEVDLPPLAAGEARVRVLAAGICGSDVAAYLGRHPYRLPPVISGHEAVGEVEALGAGANGFAIGTRVVIEPQVGCGTCFLCGEGRYNLCRSKRLMGTPGWPGAFAQYVTAPVSCLHAVPGGFSLRQAVLVEPLSVAVHSVARAGPLAGRTVAILGCGAIGLMHLIVARQKKPGMIVCTDVSADKLRIARSLGATHVLNPNETDAADAVLAAERRGVDLCFVVFHSDATVRTGLRMTRPGGRIVVVANFESEPGLDLADVQLREKEILGTAMYTRRDYEKAIRLAGEAGAALARLVTHEIGLDELPATLAALSGGRMTDAIRVVVNPG
ncbi:MAG: alcohol dehydrogenase catalytic domain-containing protein [Kiritimatiellae bacterium]|nr:alcohol dehydrogenase catalytic domain-containing protein [Kiritimatiellia bacterium]